MNGLPTVINNQIACMQSFNDMAKSLRHVFTYLKIKELLSVSRVCTTWNMISMDKFLVRNLQL